MVSKGFIENFPFSALTFSALRIKFDQPESSIGQWSFKAAKVATQEEASDNAVPIYFHSFLLPPIPRELLFVRAEVHQHRNLVHCNVTRSRSEST
jgi:hypothetical protein